MNYTTLPVLTKSEIIDHYDYTGCLLLPNGYDLYIMHPGGDRLSFYFFAPDNTIIFSGSDFRPGSGYPAIDDIGAIVSLLSFLTLQEGATDREYFANYTPDQIEFRDSSDCEEINLLIYDYEITPDNSDDIERHIQAVEYFNKNWFYRVPPPEMNIHTK